MVTILWVTLELEQDQFYILTSTVMEPSQGSLPAVLQVPSILEPDIQMMLE